jgi:hypothetical protein
VTDASAMENWCGKVQANNAKHIEPEKKKVCTNYTCYILWTNFYFHLLPTFPKIFFSCLPPEFGPVAG